MATSLLDVTLDMRHAAHLALRTELELRCDARDVMREFGHLAHRLAYVGDQPVLRVDVRRNPWTVVPTCMSIPDGLDHFKLNRK